MSRLFDASWSLTALEQDNMIAAVIEMWARDIEALPSPPAFPSHAVRVVVWRQSQRSKSGTSGSRAANDNPWL